MSFIQFWLENKKDWENNISVVASVNADLEQRQTQYTYKEIDQRSTSLAQQLLHLKAGDASRGLKPMNAHQPIALYLSQSVHYIVSVLAVWKADFRFVSISREETMPWLQRQYLLNAYSQSGEDHLQIVLTDNIAAKDFFCQRLGSQYTVLNVTGMQVKPDCPRISQMKLPQDKISQEAHLDTPAYDAASSGSTGKPKLARNRHRGLNAVMTAHIETLKITPSSRVLCYADPGFDAHLIEIMMALGAGARLYILPLEYRKNPRRIIQYYRENNISIGIVTPTLLRLLQDQLSILPALQCLVSTGESLSPSLLSACLSRASHPDFMLVNGWGNVEASIASTLKVFDKSHLSRLNNELDVPLSVGSPIPGCRIVLLPANVQVDGPLQLPLLEHPVDPDNISLVAMNQQQLSGRVFSTSQGVYQFEGLDPAVPMIAYLVGDNVGLGYFSAGPNETGKFQRVTFFSEKKESGSALAFNTADAMRLDESTGELVFLERTDTVEKVLGKQVDLLGLENNIATALGFKSELRIFVFPKRCETTGAHQLIVVFYTSTRKHAIKFSQLLKSLMQSYKMLLAHMPDEWRWLPVWPSALPSVKQVTTVAGKTQAHMGVRKWLTEVNYKDETMPLLSLGERDASFELGPSMPVVALDNILRLVSVYSGRAVSQLTPDMTLSSLGVSSIQLTQLCEYLKKELLGQEKEVGNHFAAAYLQSVLTKNPTIVMLAEVVALLGATTSVLKALSSAVDLPCENPFFLFPSVLGCGTDDFKMFSETVESVYREKQDPTNKINFLTFDLQPLYEHGFDLSHFKLLAVYIASTIMKTFSDRTDFYIAGFSTGATLAFAVGEALERSGKRCHFIAVDAVPGLELVLLDKKTHLKYIEALDMLRKLACSLDLLGIESLTYPTLKPTPGHAQSILMLFERLREHIVKTIEDLTSQQRKLKQCSVAEQLALGTLGYEPQRTLTDIWVARAEASQVYQFFKQQVTDRWGHGMGWPTRNSDRQVKLSVCDHFTLFKPTLSDEAEGASNAAQIELLALCTKVFFNRKF